MEKIKKSFKKAFLPILIASILIMLFDFLEARARGGVWYLYDKLPGHSFMSYSQSDYFILEVLRYLVGFIFAMVTSPFLCGIYSFCFARLNDEKPNIRKIFHFYRSFKRILMSVIAVRVLAIFSEIQFIFKSLQLLYTEKNFHAPTIYTVGVVFSGLLYIAAVLFLYFWKFAYSEAPERGLITALKKSRCCILVAVPTLILLSALYFICLKIIPISNWDYLILLTYFALRNWIGFTIYYMVISGGVNLKIFEKTIQKINEKGVEAAKNAAYNIGGSYVYAQNSDFENDEIEEEKPFIEPYDFFIEADERFNDEKVIETEDIRGVDILAVLDEMELADDIKIDLAIRKKLKKMFDELSFEIGEYVTYEGGREIENDFTEEIDEREFEVSVEITRNSDYEPFKLTLRVNVLKED